MIGFLSCISLFPIVMGDKVGVFLMLFDLIKMLNSSILFR